MNGPAINGRVSFGQVEEREVDVDVEPLGLVSPHYRILAHERSRFTHYYFYIRDEVLGPMVLLVASFFPVKF
jgi:hypothetical protein